MSKTKWLLSIGLLVFILTLVFYSYKNFNNKKFNKEEFLLKIKGKANNDNDYIYLNVWNTSCIPCIREMPSLDSLASIYKNKVQFVFITDDKDVLVNDFLERKNIDLKNFDFLNNQEEAIDYLCKKINKSKVYPMHFILNREFEIIHHHTAFISVEGSFDPILTKALKKLK